MAQQHRPGWTIDATHGASWDAQGKPFYPTSDGMRYYIPFAMAAQSSEPKLQAWGRSNGVTDAHPTGNVPHESLLRTSGTWNPETGKYDTSVNWKNVMNMGIGGMIAAPFIAPALAGGASGATTTAASTAGAGATTAGAGTAATTAAAVGGGSTMTWLTPLLNYGVPATTSLINNAQQRSADAEAQRIQNEFLEKALENEKENEQYRRKTTEEQRDYSRGQYANYLGRLTPYSDAGNSAVGRASSLLTTSRYQPQMAASPQGRGVQMRAPDGSMQMVPETAVDHYESRGAVRV